MANSEYTGRQLDEVTDTVRALVDLMRVNGLTSVDVSAGDVSIRLKAGSTPKVTRVAVSTAEAKQAEVDAIAEAQPGFLITAPMIGTYYTSAGPGEPSFVRPGERIEIGQTIGIIEAMKIMNEIPAERSGVVLEVLASNAQAVEYGSPLLRIALDETEG